MKGTRYTTWVLAVCMMLTVAAVTSRADDLESGDAASRARPAFALRTTSTALTESPPEQSLGQDAHISLRLPRVVGLALSGQVSLADEWGYARVIAVTESGRRLLVYSTDQLVQNREQSFEAACTETCALDIPERISGLELQTQSVVEFRLTEISYIPAGKSVTASERQVRVEQQVAIVDQLNREIARRGDHWVAGPTGVSSLPFQELEILLGGRVPALGGLLYYKGGYFPLPGARSATGSGRAPAAGLKDSGEPFHFDWRDRHGQNWMTMVGYQTGCWMGDHMDYEMYWQDCQNQGYEWRSCGNCWAHSALGPVEAMINLYFNQHVNRDLSQQDLVSCGPGSCSGGMPVNAMNYIASQGVVDEACFPDQLQNAPCSDKCAGWEHRVWKTGPPEAVDSRDFEVKQAVLESGPLSIVYWNWSHAMTLAGFGEITPGYYWPGLTIPEDDPLIGKTFWLVKNSWGADWGDGDGYGKFVTSPGPDFSNFYAVGLPVVPPPLYVSLGIACTDADGDGLCWWGLGGKRPLSCPLSCAAAKAPDCDDSDPSLGACPADYVCGNHPLLPSGESGSFGDYQWFGQRSCCGDNPDEYPAGLACCDDPNNAVGLDGVCRDPLIGN